MRIVSICAALLVLGGCASQPALVAGGTAPVVVANSTTDIKPETKLVCHKESPAGSNMIHTVCETEQTQAERDALQNRMMNNTQANGGVHIAPGH
jgi:starvation-inducible outer membrane lipoprotein